MDTRRGKKPWASLKQWKHARECQKDELWDYYYILRDKTAEWTVNLATVKRERRDKRREPSWES